MDDKRFEELRQKVMEASVGISPYGTSPNYGSSSGADPAATLGFLNKQTANDEDWKAVKAFYNGIVVQGGRGVVGALKMARDYNVYTRREKDPNYQPMEEGIAILDNLENSSALQRYDVRGNSALGQFGLDVVEGGGQLAGQVGATILTGGAGGLAIMGAQIAGNQYLDLRKAGVEVPRAAIASLGNAAFQAPMERLSLGKMMKVLPAGSSLKKKGLQILESALTEGITEFLQQYPEEMANIYAMNKGKDVRQMAAEFDRQFVDITKDAAYSGVIGALLGGGGSSINVALERHAHNAKIEALQERIDMERKSGVSADFIAGTVNNNLPGSTIAVDGETLLQYAQTKNLEEVAKALGVELQEIEKAAEDGLSVDVLQGNFEATELKMPGFLEAVRDDITFADGGYSANKEKYQRMLQKETERIADMDTDLQEQLDTIFNSMRDAGVNKQTAADMVKLYRSVAVAANPYEPAQYFREHPVEFRRDGDAVYEQAAMKRQSFDSMEGFAAELEGKPAAQASKIGNWVKTSKGGEFIIPGSNYLHVQNGNHPLSIEQWQAVIDNIENAEYAQLDNVKGRNGGKPVQIKIDTPLGKAGVSMEVLPNGKVLLVTAVFNNDAAIDNWIKNKKSSQTLGIESEGQQNRLLGRLSLIDIIKDKLGIVKEDKYNQEIFDVNNPNIYKQTAYHGSPHKFKNFDLGAIGTGEGAQAHGWGLYFAKDKKIASNNYRFIGKAADNSVTVGGEPILELAYRLADTANYTKDPVKAQEYYDKVTILEDVESSGTTAGITVEDYPEAAVKWFKREIKPRVRIKGSLFEVDIPENNVLLDEQKALGKQDKNVKSLLKKFYAELNNEQKRILKENLKQSLKKSSPSEEYEKNAARKREVDLTLSRLDRLEPQEGEPKYAAKIREFSLSNLKDAGYDIDRLKTDQQYYDSIVEPLKAEQTALQEVLTAEEQSIEFAYNKELERIEKSRGAGLFEGNVTGGDLYAAISEVFGSARDASEALNAAGIKGITYDGDLDGRCFVVFDDQAIKVINKYNQAAGSKSNTANRAALQEAYNREIAGETRDEIFKTTGWYRGDDGRWRYEIPDNIDKVRRDLEENHAYHLGDIYDNEALYEAYPWLRLEIVETTDRLPQEVTGMADPKNNTIYLNQHLINSDFAASTLIHEVQHVIQNYEEFARGGSPRMFKDISEKAKLLDGFEADAQAAWEKIPDQLKDAARIINRGDDIDGSALAAINADPEARAAWEEYNFAYEMRKKIEAEPDEKYRTTSAVEQYRNLAGEIEARDTSARSAGRSRLELYKKMLVDFKERNGDNKDNMPDDARAEMENIEKSIQGLESDLTTPPKLNDDAIVIFGNEPVASYSLMENVSEENKGGIGWDDAGKAIINLFSEADASTVIHESGHFFVENLARDVNEGHATEQQSKDWQTMLKYAEITNEEWLSMDTEKRRAAHERWAEGFETYIMEGRAPSRELRSVFKRFADWLKAIYEKYKRNTNAVPLNDDVRQVFDRILASEEDIKEMERINGYFAKLPKVITDSLSESSKKRIADYMLKAEDKAIELLTKQSLVNFTDDRKERIEAFRADILPQIRDELSKSPLYSACADVEAYTMDTHQKAKTVARRYLNEDGREYANWREELDAVQGDISDRLLPIIEQLQSGMNQGVAFVRDPESGKYVRHSNNDYWYSLWYKQHGRMLTKRDLRQLAYEIYTGERSNVLPGWENDSAEAAEHFKEAKAELDELMQREQELLEQKDDVSKYRYRGLNKEDRITFDLLAERYNYSSGSELAQEIMREPTLERAITLKADAMVQEAFPDIYKERALAEQAAREAFYNDDTGLVIGLEQQLIEDKAAEELAQERSMEARERLAQARRQQAKQAAKKELSQMSVSDAIRTDRFIAAERKAAAQAATALAKEDYAAALRYKNKQALNHAMARESLFIKDTVNQYKRYINRQFSAKKETWLNDEHFSQAAAIMQRMGFRRRDYDPDMRLASLADYAAKMQDLYDIVDIAGWILNEENSLRNPLQMTFGQFEDVVNALKNIKAIVRANKGDNMLGGAMDYAGYQTKAEGNLRKLKSKYKPVLGERQTAGYWETFIASMENTDNLFEDMDNASYGFFSKTMGSAIKSSNDSEAIHKIKFEERTAGAYREWLPDKAAEEAADKKVWYDELGASADKHTLTKMLMNLGNEGNARVLCTTVPAGIASDSELWVEPGYGVTREEAIEQTKANLLEFLGKVLTKEDIRYVQKKVDIAGMYWDEMSAMERRTKGFAPRKVEALPVEMMLANGEKVVFRGGYFPLIRDRQMGSSPQGQVPIADTDPQQGRNIRTLSTSNGNLKERVEATYPVDLTRGAEFKVMDNAIHDLCWRETMNDFRKLFNDEHMYGLMKEKLGIARLQAFREMLEKAAQPNGTASADLAETTLSRTASWLRRKTVNAAIMLNMKTAVQNFGNIFLYGRVVEGFGYSDVLAAMGNWHMNLQSAGNYASMDALIMEKSVFMRERSVLPDITLRDLYAEGKMNKLERKTVEWGTKVLVYTDNFTAKPIWLQAYMKKINSGASEREAVDFADLIIRRTLGSSRITDVSSLQRGGKLFKLFTTFQGFFNTQFNQWVREANIDMRLWKEGHKGKAAMNMTAFIAAKYLVFCLVNLALAFEDPFEEDDDEWLQISKELTHYPMSLMGPIGQAGNALLDQMLGMRSYGYRMSAIQSSIDSSLRMGSKLHKIIADDDPLSDLIEPATGLAGTVIGVPQQFNKWFFNAYDILFNDMDAEFGDFYRRRPKRER